MVVDFRYSGTVRNGSVLDVCNTHSVQCRVLHMVAATVEAGTSITPNQVSALEALAESRTWQVRWRVVIARLVPPTRARSRWPHAETGSYRTKS